VRRKVICYFAKVRSRRCWFLEDTIAGGGTSCGLIGAVALFQR